LSFIALGCKETSSPSGDSAPLDARTQRNTRPAAEEGRSNAPVEIEIFAPEDGDHAGREGLGWFIDLAVVFPPMEIRRTGFAGEQLTGPGVHANAPPMPGAFAPGKDEKFAGLIVLLSTTTIGAESCQNLANLFNLTGVTNKDATEVEIWDTWIISARLFGHDTPSTLYVAEAADLNHNGIFDDAPDVVPDSNGDGKCDDSDVKAVGLASDAYVTDFFIR
jgi:hypothetical protein